MNLQHTKDPNSTSFPAQVSSASHRAPLSQPSTPSHELSCSADFGAFNEAPNLNQPGSSRPPRFQFADQLQPQSNQQPFSLLDDDDDLQGASNHLKQLRPMNRSAQASPHDLTPPSSEIDLLGGDVWEDATPQVRSQPVKAPPSTPQYRPNREGPTSSPIHVTLPPRPSEISPEYVPPLRSPRRMSSFSFSLSSPPIVTDAGNDIIFHPSHQPVDDNAASEMRKVQARSDSTYGSFSPSSPEKYLQDSGLRRSVTRSPPHQSKLLDTLATTTKIASKWRSAISNSTFVPPHHSSLPEQHSTPGLSHAEPIPIDVTHQTPFATPEQIAGSYRPPSGAPGFNPHQVADAKHNDQNEDEWGQIRLKGRRESTAPVLQAADAHRLRRHLPPRQLSLDQHGASLSTLYRLVDMFAQTHKTSGNVLVVRDARGNRFGVFLNESIVKREGTYYGSGESFLFKLSHSSDAQVFKWTGKNQYFALCEAGFISFGGGDGKYGLLLDSTFTRNSSATSPAYNNDVLSESLPRKSNQASLFDCIGLEVWGT
ncbi:uncharacterized protein I206_107199 [Kwoniella pini CBS 10737]|uniref:Oxidation resistance protein 1 n=1 Tax=Kwoniella pini CBS 10737 TaxID=1296096 RepID=A0AAJ8LC02_9TREE